MCANSCTYTRIVSIRNLWKQVAEAGRREAAPDELAERNDLARGAASQKRSE